MQGMIFQSYSSHNDIMNSRSELVYATWTPVSLICKNQDLVDLEASELPFGLTLWNDIKMGSMISLHSYRLKKPCSWARSNMPSMCLWSLLTMAGRWFWRSWAGWGEWESQQPGSWGHWLWASWTATTAVHSPKHLYSAMSRRHLAKWERGWPRRLKSS